MWWIRRPNALTVLRTDVDWDQLWVHLASDFKELKHVRLNAYGSNAPPLSETDLEPLLDLKALKTFDLAIWQDNNGSDALPASMPLQAFVRQRICK